MHFDTSILREYLASVIFLLVALSIAITFWDNGGKALSYYLFQRHRLVGGILSSVIVLLILLEAGFLVAGTITASYLSLVIFVSVGITFIFGLSLSLTDSLVKQSHSTNAGEQQVDRVSQHSPTINAAGTHEAVSSDLSFSQAASEQPSASSEEHKEQETDPAPYTVAPRRGPLVPHKLKALPRSHVGHGHIRNKAASRSTSELQRKQEMAAVQERAYRHESKRRRSSEK